MDILYYTKAISNLLGSGVAFTISGTTYSTLEIFGDEAKPSEAAIKAEYDKVLAANKYKDDREVAYPSIQDQLDMQYHDAVNGTTTWKDAVAKVKTDNPKPEGGE